jgi:hypothetical protein
MGPIAHLLCEDISRVDPTWDVENLQRGILNPFTDGVLSHLHVTNLLSCHVVRPLNTRFVVVVERGGHRGVRDVVTTFPDGVRKMTYTH